MRPVSAVMLRSSFVCAAALALTGCMRGCDLGPPAEPCERTDECDAPDVCHRGYCSSPAYVEEDRSCRAAPACRELGRCRATTVRSFLGIDNSRECVARYEEDCRAAKVCEEKGLCSLGDAWCIARSDEDCAGSRRCETHDECFAEGHECVRRLPECTPGPPAGAPAWANVRGTHVHFDMQQMPAAWQPGAVESAVVACQVALSRGGHSRVQVGEHCFDGPYFERGGGLVNFVQSGVRLRPDATVFVASHGERTVGTAEDSYVKARYTGSSPFAAGTEHEHLLCHVVPPEVARPIGLAALPAVDAAIAAASPKPTDDHRSTPRPLDDARRATRIAAAWLGWNDPEITARVQRMEALDEAYARTAAVALARLRKTAPAPGKPLVFRNEVALQVLGHVCGAELDARRGPGARSTTDVGQCGVELRIENRGIERLSLGGADRSLGNLEQVRWLQVSGGLAETIGAALIDVRPATAGAVPGRTTELEPGAAAVVLLAGDDKDITPGRDAPGEFTLLAGRVYYGSEFLLRSELPARPARGARTKRK